MKHENIQLVRKGTAIQDPQREAVVRITPPAASPLLPAILTRQPFVVPRGLFAKPIDMDGNPIRTRVPLTNEPVEIHPELLIHGVADADGGERLAIALFHNQQNQIITIADRIDGIFRSFIGLHPDMAQLQELSEPYTPAYIALAARIQEELGLKVDWTLQPEPRAAKLLEQLRIRTPVQKTLTFNAELPAEEFRLTFTLTVERADLRQINQIIRRAESGRSVDEEIWAIFERVKHITAPAFRSALMGVTQWNQEIIRELSSDGIANVVSRKIQEDFGYVVKFTNFSAELNKVLATHLAALAQQSRTHNQEDIDRTRGLITQLKNLRAEALLAAEGNYEDVEYLETRIRRAEEEHEQARKIHLNAIANNTEVKLLETSEPVTVSQLQIRFNQALMLDETSEAERKYGKPRN